MDPGGIGAFAIDFSGAVGREAPVATVSGFSLGSPYPNPATRSVTIPFTLTRPTHATIEVWDLLGRRVRVVPAGTQALGAHEIVIGVGDLPSGIYLYRLLAGGTSRSGKMVVQ